MMAIYVKSQNNLLKSVIYKILNLLFLLKWPQMFSEFWCSPNSQTYLYTQMIGTTDFVSQPW